MAEIKETAFDWTSDNKWATFCTNEQKWINKVRKLKEENDGDIEIVDEPEDNGGVMVVHIPKTYFKLNSSKRKPMTEEQKKAAGERMRKMRNNKKQEGDEDDDE